MQEHRRAHGPSIDLDYDQTSTLARFSRLVGTRNIDHKGNVFILVPGVASGVAGAVIDIVGAASGMSVNLITAARALLNYPIAVMCSAISATTTYGWALLRYTADADAKFGIITDASAAAETRLRTGATAGRLTTVHVASSQTIYGRAVLQSATGGSAAVNLTASWDLLRGTV